MKYRPIYLLISLAFLLPGMYFLVTSGLKPALDFTGGTVVEVRLEKEASVTAVREELAEEPFTSSIISETGNKTYNYKQKREQPW